MPIHLTASPLKELKPRIVVCGVGGAGGNAINNMIVSGLSGVEFVVANTDAGLQFLKLGGLQINRHTLPLLLGARRRRLTPSTAERLARQGPLFRQRRP